MSYAVPEVSKVLARRSSSALGKPSDEVPKEVPNPSPRRGQFGRSRKDRYSKGTDNKSQVLKQRLPSEIAAQTPLAPPVHTPYYPTPLGVEISPNKFHTSIYQPSPILQSSMVKKPAAMGFTNDVRNLISRPTSATATPLAPIQQAMYMPYQTNPLGAENQYPRIMGGFRPGADFDQTQRVFGSYPANSSFGGHNAFDHARYPPNDHRSAVPLSPHAGYGGRHRRSFSNQAQSAFHQPAAANNLGMVSPMVLPVINQYRHLSTGQLSTQVPWPHEGSFPASPNSATATGFREQQPIRQNGPQRNMHQVQGDSRPLDDKTLWVGRFTGQIDLEKLRSMFARCGPVDYIDPIRKSKMSGASSHAFTFVKSVAPTLFLIVANHA